MIVNRGCCLSLPFKVGRLPRCCLRLSRCTAVLTNLTVSDIKKSLNPRRLQKTKKIQKHHFLRLSVSFSQTQKSLSELKFLLPLSKYKLRSSTDTSTTRRRRLFYSFRMQVKVDVVKVVFKFSDNFRLSVYTLSGVY